MADYERHVWLGLNALAVGSPEETCPELGLASGDGGELHVLTFVTADGDGSANGKPPKSVATMFVLNQQQFEDLVDGLVERRQRQLAGDSIVIPTEQEIASLPPRNGG